MALVVAAAAASRGAARWGADGAISVRRPRAGATSVRRPRAFCTADTPQAAVPPPAVGASPAVASRAAPEVHRCQRLGEGDQVVELNVGGKTFITLRSTVQCSPMLAEHLSAAQVHESLKTGNAVFVDRDPEHFATLLNYMRNYTAGVKLTACGLQGEKKVVIVAMPQDYAKLRDLYIEARYYGLNDFAKTVCGRSTLAKIYSASGGMANPLEAAANFAIYLRRGVVLLSGVGLITMAPSTVNASGGGGSSNFAEVGGIASTVNSAAGSIDHAAHLMRSLVESVKKVT